MAKNKKDAPYKSTKRDHFTIVLEGLKSDFRAFGEGLDFIRQDIAEMKKDIYELLHKGSVE